MTPIMNHLPLSMVPNLTQKSDSPSNMQSSLFSNDIWHIESVFKETPSKIRYVLLNLIKCINNPFLYHSPIHNCKTISPFPSLPLLQLSLHKTGILKQEYVPKAGQYWWNPQAALCNVGNIYMLLQLLFSYGKQTI